MYRVTLSPIFCWHQNKSCVLVLTPCSTQSTCANQINRFMRIKSIDLSESIDLICTSPLTYANLWPPHVALILLCHRVLPYQRQRVQATQGDDAEDLHRSGCVRGRGKVQCGSGSRRWQSHNIWFLSQPIIYVGTEHAAFTRISLLSFFKFKHNQGAPPAPPPPPSSRGWASCPRRPSSSCSEEMALPSPWRSAAAVTVFSRLGPLCWT